MVIISQPVDDREGCRSLVCDSNGIIVAEMVYRCMICATVSDCIADAQKHYQSKHIDAAGNRRRRYNHGASAANNASPEPPLRPEDDDMEGSVNGDDLDGQPESSDELGAADRATLTFNLPAGLKRLQEINGCSGGESDEEDGEGPTTPLPVTASGRPPLRSATYGNRGGGGFQAAPDPLGDGSNSRGGYVTCAVCNITKFYASVQRRYGQFTCMGCAKFFGRFLLKPRRYCCPSLGTCPLDVSPRCKGCLLLACVNTYNVDERRMAIVNANRPLRKAASGGANNSSNSGVAVVSSSSSTSITAAHASSRTTSASTATATSAINTLPVTQQRPVQSHQPQGTIRVSQQQQQQRATAAATQLRRKAVARARTVSRGRSGLLTLVIKSRVPVNAGTSSLDTGNSGQKQWSCRKCPGCLVEDCGACNYCLDKPKFGGPNTLKKKCIDRKCNFSSPIAASQSQPNSSSSSATRSTVTAKSTGTRSATMRLVRARK